MVGLIARNYGQLTIWRRGTHETDEEEGRLSRVQGKGGGLWYSMLWHRMEWKEGMVWGFCLKDLNRKGSGKGEGKIQRTHMASGSWNPLKHMHLMLVACGSVCPTNLRVHMSMDGVQG